MKKVILLSLATLLLAGCIPNEQQTNSLQIADMEKSTNGIWSSIDETTWWRDNNWAGETYIFYTDNHGAKKCIHQIQGSGVYITSRRFVDFEIINDNEIKIENISYKLNGDKLVSDELTLTLYSDKPLIYNRTEPVTIEIVKSDEFVVEDIDKQYEDQKR